MLFDTQSPEALAAAIRRFESDVEETLDVGQIVAHAQQFSPERFKHSFMSHLKRCEPDVMGHLDIPAVRSNGVLNAPSAVANTVQAPKSAHDGL